MYTYHQNSGYTQKEELGCSAIQEEDKSYQEQYVINNLNRHEQYLLGNTYRMHQIGLALCLAFFPQAKLLRRQQYESKHCPVGITHQNLWSEKAGSLVAGPY